MNINFRELFEKSYSIDLHEIQFESAAYIKAKITLWDEIDFYKSDKNEVVFKFSRIVKTVPKSSINVKVSFLVSRKLKHEEDAKIEWKEFLANLTEDELDELGGNIYARISMLISQITSSDASSPLITAPVPYMKKNK